MSSIQFFGLTTEKNQVLVSRPPTETSLLAQGGGQRWAVRIGSFFSLLKRREGVGVTKDSVLSLPCSSTSKWKDLSWI